MKRLVLASTSRYRRQLLAEAGLDIETVAPDFDERSLDDHYEDWGPDRYVVEVAAGKARSCLDDVRGSYGDAIVIAADQIAVFENRLLTKPGTVDAAVAQLVALAGTSHELVNGVVALAAGTGRMAAAVDRHRVVMRDFDEPTARRYVEEFLPLDTVGAYRLEDPADLVESTEGSGRDGIIGLPIGLVRSLVERVSGS